MSTEGTPARSLWPLGEGISLVLLWGVYLLVVWLSWRWLSL